MGCDAGDFNFKGYKAEVSIHAPAWGATAFRLRDVLQYIVSIHAPAWGATWANRGNTHLIAFQSTHPHGVRLNDRFGSNYTILFQSTHPHGVRLLAQMYISVHLRFQSTHPHGVRLELILQDKNPPVSIHAPAWGATSQLDPADYTDLVSIHAPAWGATA